ncbi:hypothetical protein KSP39_PZI016671 [Platanthera zijinensis]|uniref:Uncharacterized protein n=1 Tax=Platanthera zijinensis TaxID=2320716 RepID=A0AAP0B7S9_9ASPA
MDSPPAPKTLFSDDPLMSLALSHRFPHLLTNCDLPPPLKLFSPPAIDDNHGVLRALRLSQTRARAAEDRAQLVTARIGRLASLLLEESLLLSAHRRWVAMLEFEVAGLRRRISQPVEDDGGDIGAAEIVWCLALALCIGIAGVGFARGRCLL